MKIETNLPSLQDFRKQAKELKKIERSHQTLNSALNALAHRFGYKSWNHIKNKLMDVPSPIKSGTLAINNDVDPKIVLSFKCTIADKLYNGIEMKYTTIQGNNTLYSGSLLTEAYKYINGDFTSLYKITKDMSKEEGHNITINGVSILDAVFDDSRVNYIYMHRSQREAELEEMIDSADSEAEVISLNAELEDITLFEEDTKHPENNFIFANDNRYDFVTYDDVDFNKICQTILDVNMELLGYSSNFANELNQNTKEGITIKPGKTLEGMGKLTSSTIRDEYVLTFKDDSEEDLYTEDKDEALSKFEEVKNEGAWLQLYKRELIEHPDNVEVTEGNIDVIAQNLKGYAEYTVWLVDKNNNPYETIGGTFDDIKNAKFFEKWLREDSSRILEFLSEEQDLDMDNLPLKVIYNSIS